MKQCKPEMGLKQHFELMAEYNRWMNEKVYSVAGNLSETALSEDRGAFFTSILGTLNHIVVADRMWLKRFAANPGSSELLREVSELPDPTSLDQVIFNDIASLGDHRKWLDEKIVQWVPALTTSDLNSFLFYHNSKGVAFSKCFSALILHFFNHQTHHRGQASTLLLQAGEDIGVTDLLALI